MTSRTARQIKVLKGRGYFQEPEHFDGEYETIRHDPGAYDGVGVEFSTDPDAEGYYYEREGRPFGPFPGYEEAVEHQYQESR